MIYVSSIINKYGDPNNVKTDVIATYDIYDRQGSLLLIDCIAERVGLASIKFKLTNKERQDVINSLVSEFKNALEERM